MTHFIIRSFNSGRDISYRKEFEQLLLGTFVWTSFIFKMYETKILYCPKISFAVNTLSNAVFFSEDRKVHVPVVGMKITIAGGWGNAAVRVLHSRIQGEI